MNIRRGLIGSLLLCSAVQCPLSATPLNGNALDFYSFFTGTLDPVMIDLGAGPVSTGTISYTLDPANPAGQQFAFDFDTLIATAEVDLLINFPLLQTLGEPAIRLHVSESGPIVSGVPDVPVGSGQALTFEALLTGGGTVQPGSPFAGFIYHNLNDTTVVKNVNVQAGGKFNETVNGGGNVTITATITPPAGTGMPTQGKGKFGIGPNPIPEPSTVLLSLSAALALLGLRRIRSV